MFWQTSRASAKSKSSNASARVKIEAAPNAASLEMMWYRSKPRQFNPCAKKRMPDSLLARHPKKGEYSSIHTHVLASNAPEANTGGSVMSRHDLLHFALSAMQKDVRYFHIATLLDGKVAGYVSYAATPDFIRYMKTEIAHYQNTYEKFEYSEPQFLINLQNGGVCKGKEWKLEGLFVEVFRDLRRRITLMPGYAFDSVCKVFRPA